MNKRKTYDLEKLYKLSYVDIKRTEGVFQIPRLAIAKDIPLGLINFKSAMRSKEFEKYVHFYLNDGEFECLWRNPERYIKRLKHFSGVLSPDFSLYTDMPVAVQVWNTFRSRILGRILQQSGCNVVPSISWSDSRSFSFAFDGIQKHSIVSVSSVGIWRDKKAYKLFLAGLSVMIEKIKPRCIIFYGKIPDYNFGNIKSKSYSPDTFLWKK